MKVVFSVALLATASAAFAQGPGCNGIKADKARLACYDKAAVQPATPSITAQPTIPKQASLPAGVVFKSGNWHVNQKTDEMTDKKSCTALYQNAWTIQGTARNLYISYRGRGGIQSYTLRFDETPPDEMQLATPAEKDLSAVILEPNFSRIYAAKRLRIQSFTVLSRVLVEDIDLNGFKEAVDYMRESCQA